jgi:hypothetical protein
MQNKYFRICDTAGNMFQVSAKYPYCTVAYNIQLIFLRKKQKILEAVEKDLDSGTCFEA